MDDSVHVLVVNDEPDLLNATSFLLQKAGYKVTGAAGGKEALTLSHQERPAIVLLDREMPYPDGVVVCKRIKSDPNLEGTIVLLVSGSFHESNVDFQELEAGADGYLTRPINDREFLAWIGSYAHIWQLNHHLLLQKEELSRNNKLMKQSQLASLNLMEDAIAARDRAEHISLELRESEERYRSLVMNAPDAILVNLNDRVAFANQEALRLFGADAAEELVGKSVYDLFHPDYHQMLRSRINQLREKREAVPAVEEKIVRLDGQTVDVEAAGSPFVIGGETAIHVILRDITRRKMAEAAQHATDILYRGLFETMAEGYAYCQALYENDQMVDFVYLAVNSAFEKQTGLRDVIGKKVSEVAPGIQVVDPDVFKFYARVVETGESENTEMFVASLNMWFAVSAYCPRPGFFVAIFEVISERKRMEEDLRSAARFTYENPDAVIRVSQDGRLLFANPQALRLLPEWELKVGERVSAVIQGVVLECMGSTARLALDLTHGEQTFSFLVVPVVDSSYANLYGHDVTHLRQQEEALRASEARYRMLAENMSDTIWLMDMNLRTVYISPSVTRLRGYTLEEINLIPLDKQMTADSFQRSMTLFMEALSPVNLASPKPQTTYTIDLEFFRKDGSCFWSENTFTLIFNETGQPVNIMGTARDITERKSAEDAIRRSEARFSTMFKASPAAISVFNTRDDTYVDVNSAWQELTGYTRKEALGQSAFQINLWVQPEIRRRLIEAAYRQETVRVEADIRHKSGEVRQILVSAAEIDLAGERFLLTMAQDISERKAAEVALRDVQRRLQNVIRGARVGTWEWNAQSDAITFDDECYRMLGYTTAAEVTIRTMAELTAQIHPADLNRIIEELQQYTNSGAEFIELEYRIKHKDGRWIWVNDRGSIITRSADGSPLMLFGTHIDVSERKQAEQALRISEEHYRMLFTTMINGFALIELKYNDQDAPIDFKVLEVNPAHERITTLKTEKVLGKLVSESTPGIDPLWINTYHNVDKTGNSEYFEWHGEEPYRWYGVHVYRVAHHIIAAIFEDITERKRAEVAARESEERYRSLVYASIQGIMVHENGVILDVNQAFLKLFGYEKPEDLIGKIGWDFMLSPESRESMKQRVGEQASGPRELMGIRSDGTRFTLETESQPINYAGHQARIVSCQDITARKLAQEALRESEEKLRATLAQSQDGILLTDENLNIIEWNDAQTAIFGHTKEEMVGKPLLEFQLAAIPESARTVEMLDRLSGAMQTAGKVQTAAWSRSLQEFEVLSTNGLGKTVETSIFPIRIKDTTIFGSFSRDVTERKKSEAKLLVNLKREELLVNLGRELNGTFDELSIYQIVTRNLRKVMPFNDLGIELFDINRCVLNPVYVDVNGIHIDSSQLSPLPVHPEKPQDGRTLAIVKQKAVILNDISERLKAGSEVRLVRNRSPKCAIYVPIITEGQVNGILVLQSNQENAYNEEDRAWLEGVANLLGLAIGNARLYIEAQRTAVAEERNRLAGELHDDVSQVLFSSNITANMLLRTLEGDPAKLKLGLIKLRQLNKGALAEMRTLLMELRPATLLKTSIKVLLTQLVDTVGGRSPVEVNFSIDDVKDLPPDVHIALYRIAQEAMNNVTKHANAGHMALVLRVEEPGVYLEISDDGCGFVPDMVSAEHQGLQIMRERAEKLAMILEIKSKIGEGTLVGVHWSGELRPKEDE